MDIEQKTFEAFESARWDEFLNRVKNDEEALHERLLFSQLAINGLNRVMTQTPLERTSVLSVASQLQDMREFNKPDSKQLTKGMVAKAVASIASRSEFVPDPRPYDEALRAAGGIIDLMVHQGLFRAHGFKKRQPDKIRDVIKWSRKTPISITDEGKALLKKALKSSEEPA